MSEVGAVTTLPAGLLELNGLNSVFESDSKPNSDLETGEPSSSTPSTETLNRYN